MAMDTWIETFSGAVLKALATSIPNCRPRDHTRPRISAYIQDTIRPKTRLRMQWKITLDPALTAEVNRLQKSVTRRLNEWSNDQWSARHEAICPEDQSLWQMTKWVMSVPTPTLPLVTPGKLVLSDSEKAEAIAENLEAHFQQVPIVIETGDVALKSYFLSPVSEPNVTTPEQVHEAIRGSRSVRIRTRTVHRTGH